MTARERRRLLLSLLSATVVGGVCALSYAFHLLPGLAQLQELATDATIFRPREGNVARRVALVQIGEAPVPALSLQAAAAFLRRPRAYEEIGPEALLPAGYLASWEEAVALYREGRYELAQARFERCLGARPDDGPARIYLERCVGRVPLQEGITLPLVGQGGGRPVPGIEDRP